MPTETYRGVVRGGTVVLLGDDRLPAEGTEVLVTPVANVPGTADAVLAAVHAGPKVPAGWVDELEQFMAEGRRPPTRNDPFQEGR